MFTFNFIKNSTLVVFFFFFYNTINRFRNISFYVMCRENVNNIDFYYSYRIANLLQNSFYHFN